VLSAVACPAVPYFVNIVQQTERFYKKRVVEHRMCVLTSSTNLSKRIERDIITNIYLSKHSLFISEFKEARIFSTKYSKNTQISNFMKTSSVGAKLFHADGRTRGQTGKKIDGQT